MRFLCPSCVKELSIPDEKLPKVEQFSLKCPYCREKLIINQADAANPARLVEEPLPVRPVLEEESGVSGMEEVGVSAISHAPAVAPDLAPASGSGPVSPVVPAPDSSPDGSGEPEIFPPGSKVVFLFLADPGWSAGARSFFTEQGYYTSTAAAAGEATAKLRLNAYDVLLVEDNDPGRLLLQEVAGWSGVRRRECNVVLIGEGGASLDPQPAFRRGVNSWLHRGDAERCHALLEEVLQGYGVHYELLQRAGQQGREE